MVWLIQTAQFWQSTPVAGEHAGRRQIASPPFVGYCVRSGLPGGS
jgi:hypothetical protein